MPPTAPAPSIEAPRVEPRRPTPNPVSLGAAVSAAINSESGEPAQPAAAATATTETETEVAEAREENALVSSSEAITALEEESLIERQSVEARLPVQLNVGIPIRDFRVKNLLVLAPGALIESQWEPGEDVPVVSGEVQLAWSEFEVVDTQLAVRLTRLT
jgi:flagellar motor switch/type III secretory pathway protein FliN